MEYPQDIYDIRDDLIPKKQFKFELSTDPLTPKQVYFVYLSNLKWKLTLDRDKLTINSMYFTRPSLWKADMEVHLKAILKKADGENEQLDQLFNIQFDGIRYRHQMVHSIRDKMEGSIWKNVMLDVELNLKSTENVNIVPVSLFNEMPADKDIIINVEGKKILVNKLYLAFFSEFFNVMFFGAIPLPDEPTLSDKFEHVMAFLRFIYPNNAPITKNSLTYLLPLADQYQCRRLADACEMFMCAHPEIYIKNPGLALRCADAYKMQRLMKATIAHMSTTWCVTSVKKASFFSSLSNTMKCAILERFTDEPKGRICGCPIHAQDIETGRQVNRAFNQYAARNYHIAARATRREMEEALEALINDDIPNDNDPAIQGEEGEGQEEGENNGGGGEVHRAGIIENQVARDINRDDEGAGPAPPAIPNIARENGEHQRRRRHIRRQQRNQGRELRRRGRNPRNHLHVHVRAEPQQVESSTEEEEEYDDEPGPHIRLIDHFHHPPPNIHGFWPHHHPHHHHVIGRNPRQGNIVDNLREGLQNILVFGDERGPRVNEPPVQVEIRAGFGDNGHNDRQQNRNEGGRGAIMNRNEDRNRGNDMDRRRDYGGGWDHERERIRNELYGRRAMEDPQNEHLRRWNDAINHENHRRERFEQRDERRDNDRNGHRNIRNEGRNNDDREDRDRRERRYDEQERRREEQEQERRWNNMYGYRDGWNPMGGRADNNLMEDRRRAIERDQDRRRNMDNERRYEDDPRGEFLRHIEERDRERERERNQNRERNENERRRGSPSPPPRNYNRRNDRYDDNN